MKTYPYIDPETLGEHYEKHLVAMTVERLESKADIAAQLALRDQEIERLQAALSQQPQESEVMNTQRMAWCSEYLSSVFQDVSGMFYITYLNSDGFEQTTDRFNTLYQAIDAAMQKDTK